MDENKKMSDGRWWGIYIMVFWFGTIIIMGIFAK